MPTTNPSRRQFVKRATAASAFAFQVVPSSVWGANERLQVACIGIGGKGASDLGGVAKAGARIVALCDVDENRRVRKKNKDARAQFPDAPFYRDFREMLASESEKIDGVTVSTPDHAHCHAAVAA
ncbi:MAG: Gfo/Idh/MocA family oxidoreductase, partial [Verrucomicrobiota bacterium]